MKFIVSCQALENYGDEKDYFKYKSGTDYLIECDDERIALAIACCACKKWISGGWVEYPCNVANYDEWLEENPLSDEYNAFIHSNLMAVDHDQGQVLLREA